MSTTRRHLLAQGTLASAALALGCTRKDPVLHRTLPRTHGTVQGYRGLSELPYYRLDERGRVVLVPELYESLPAAIDFHAHLGMSYMFAPEIDYHRHTDEINYYVDCDDATPPCTYALDDYLNKIATPEMLEEMAGQLVATGLGGGDSAPTHTIPNLLRDMDDAKTEHAVLLAIEMPLPFRNNNTWAWLEAVKAGAATERLTVFCSVHPLNGDAVGKLKAFRQAGLTGVKLHPPMQQFRPDDPKAMALYEWCDALGMTVFFHAGRAGIEPGYSQQFAHMKYYEPAARAFPNVNFVFGHAGARDFEPAADIARRYDNVYLELEGQGVSELQYILARVDDQRLLFGSDWPFFPHVASHARVLMATEGNPTARDRILRHNAVRLLGRTG